MKRTLLRSKASRITILAIAATAGIAAVSIPAYSAETADVSIQNANAPGTVPGRYIVKFKDAQGVAAVGTAAADMTRRHGGKLRHRLDVINGYSATMSEEEAKDVARDASVASVEQAHYMVALDTQPNPPNWGDDRIDQRDLPLNQSYTYPANAGQGAHVYVLDTGINASHQDFTGRIAAGYDFVDNDSTPQDCQGHGTHVAGTAAGTSYGVAKKATIHAVRVLNCQGSGTNDDIMAGINWVKNNGVKPAVINYSIGCQQRCSSTTMDNTVKSLIASGIQFVQAAGNSNDDACFYSPQLVPEAVTVGNSTSSDAKASSSSHGSCLDIWAPGSSIVSASHSSNTGSATMTGTSMASPHVAGAAALYLGQNPSATPAQVRDALVTNASTGKLSGMTTGSPNRLLYTAFMNGGGSTTVTVANPGNQTTTVNTAASLPNSASGGTSPYSWSATGLPAGLSISASNGTISGTPTATGTSNVTVTATDSSSPAKTGSASFTWTVNPAGTCSVVSNGTDFSITDNATVESPVTVSGCSGAASATAKVDVNIVHTYIGDLTVSLVAPDGSAYVLHNKTGAGTDNLVTTYTVNLSSETANGTWKLRVNDSGPGDTGKIDTWSFNPSATGGGTSCAPASNGTNVNIVDNATVESSIALSCTGNASATSTVAVAIVHTWRGDLVIDVVAPDGTAYRLKNASANDSADNVNATYTVNLSSEARNGTWKLRVQDVETNDTGYIDNWTLTT
ncbi:Alkaline serine exoprotease A precursor [Alloactinosynnema sp. L-07]|uniref:S8 family serine peptidase n=1 Tax=Alloactinosynnema sp. L-07 TaxID=1653480 RepID=UPI00065EF15B|nr:S8 family serine peptidase [Alloactinosynnema sp. L-07]CRK62056.1 Alkaline serine exoprotease A precursor [Alloactinosynnema sp. L-07]